MDVLGLLGGRRVASLRRHVAAAVAWSKECSSVVGQVQISLVVGCSADHLDSAAGKLATHVV